MRTHTDSQTHQWGLCWANHRLSVWLMLHCLVPHNYIHNNPEPLRSLAAKSCVPWHNIQTPFQNTHNWLKCNQRTETLKVCFKLTPTSASGVKLKPAKKLTNLKAFSTCSPGPAAETPQEWRKESRSLGGDGTSEPYKTFSVLSPYCQWGDLGLSRSDKHN